MRDEEKGPNRLRVSARLDDSLADADSLAADAPIDSVRRSSPIFAERLEDRLTLGFGAVCAKPMDRLGIVYRWLIHQSESTNIHLLKLVLLGLSILCFHAQILFFKLTYAAARRQIVRLCRRSGHGSHPHYCDYFGELGLDRLTLPEAKERLRHIAGRFQEFAELLKAANVLNHQKILSLEAELTALREREAARQGHSNTQAKERALAETEGSDG